jgi:hypothetical protein
MPPCPTPSSETPGTAIVLASPQEIIPASPEINYRTFPATAEGIAMIAIERCGRKRESDADNISEEDPQICAQEQRRKEIFEKSLTNPETLQEWLIHIISKYRGEIKRNIRIVRNAEKKMDKFNETPIPYVVNVGVYPVLAEHVVFDVPESSIQDRIEAQELSAMERFILDYLYGFLTEIRNKIGVCIGLQIPSGDALKILKKLAEIQEKSDQPHGKVKLKSVIAWLTNSFSGLCQSDEVNQHLKFTTNNFTLDETIKRKCAVIDLGQKIPKIYVTPGHFLLESQNIHFVPTPNETVDEILDGLLEQLLPPVDKLSGEDTHGNALPKFRNLPLLRAQLEVHMKRLATQGKVNKVLEKHLFPDEEIISMFKVGYDAVPGRLRFGTTKRKLEDGLAQKLNPGTEKDVASLLEILDFCANAYTRASLLKEIGANEAQKREADLLLEVVGVYADFLRQIGVELEVKMTVPDMEMPDLLKVTEAMNRFGAAGENVISIAREAMENFRIVQEAVVEADEALR